MEQPLELMVTVHLGKRLYDRQTFGKIYSDFSDEFFFHDLVNWMIEHLRLTFKEEPIVTNYSDVSTKKHILEIDVYKPYCKERLTEEEWLYLLP